MWVVAWEEGIHRHKEEAPTEAAAEAHAHQLVTGKKLARVTYYFVDMGETA